LGTPDSPSVKDVRRFLREFLSDPYVIDIDPIARFLLLNCIILPTRPKKSAKAYQSIWQDAGSPLLTNSLALVDNAQELLGDQFQVALGMRYGRPSIESAVEQLKGCEKLITIPLFPQYSLATTLSTIQKVGEVTDPIWAQDDFTIMKEFYNLPSFISAQASLMTTAMRNVLPGKRKVLFSFHGLPERHIQKTSACKQVCNMETACPAITANNKDCYRAQCYATSRALAQELALSSEDYLTTFQSRLGRIPWIKPYTDVIIKKLAKDGVKHLVIACPSFVCDCLETLEEIGLRAREQWLAAGGESLTLVPCVNGDAGWVKNIVEVLTK
jgi:ferrochelatase